MKDEGTVVVEDGDLHDGDSSECHVIGPLGVGRQVCSGGAGFPWSYARRRHQTQFQVKLFVGLVLGVVDDLNGHLTLDDVRIEDDHLVEGHVILAHHGAAVDSLHPATTSGTLH